MVLYQLKGGAITFLSMELESDEVMTEDGSKLTPALEVCQEF